MKTPPYTDELAASVNVPGAVDEVTQTPAAPSERARKPFARVRRRIDRLRLDRDAGESVDGGLELKLELLLLREENVRLKSERHRRFDVGTLIDQLRLRAAEIDRAETVDEAWAALSEYFLLRENLVQAGTEIETAIAAVGKRFPGLLDHGTLGAVALASESVAVAA